MCTHRLMSADFQRDKYQGCAYTPTHTHKKISDRKGPTDFSSPHSIPLCLEHVIYHSEFYMLLDFEVYPDFSLTVFRL